MDWSKEKCLELIDEYERQPVLWDPKNKCHYNKIKKHDAWVAISNKMECTTKEVKNKMESLLSSFRREKAKRTESIGTGRGREEIYITKWYAFQRMGFLLDKDKPRETIDSVEENGNAPPSESDEGDIRVSREATNSQETEIQIENVQVSPKPSTSAIPLKQSQKRKRLVEPSPSVGTSKVDQALGFLKTAAANNDLRDEYGVFGQHVAHKLRRYNKKTRAIVQHYINNIIFSADMGNYDTQYSNQSINQPIKMSLPNPSSYSEQPSHSHQSYPNIIPVPRPSPHSQTYSGQSSPISLQNPNPSYSQSYSHQSSPNLIPLPSPSPQSQSNYLDQPSPNLISTQNSVPHSQLSFSNQPSTSQRYLNENEETYFE